MGPTEREFYQQPPGYWQQVSHNLAGWLHLQHDATAFDLVMLLPLFPLLVLAVFWWTPWERLFFKEMPKTITGPYLLYCAISFWHFHWSGWWALAFAIGGLVLCAMAVMDIRGGKWRGPEA